MRRFGNDRRDQPRRLGQQGSCGGPSGLLLLEAGALTWNPTVTVLRESSSASLLTLRGATSSRTSLTVSPEIGAVGAR